MFDLNVIKDEMKNGVLKSVMLGLPTTTNTELLEMLEQGRGGTTMIRMRKPKPLP
jgi:hypothetical protein